MKPAKAPHTWPGGCPRLQTLAAAILMLAFAGDALCLDPRLRLTQYVHTSWTQSEGSLVPGVYAVAQTADGYLWLGTARGLLRFDGLHIVPWKAAPGEQMPGTSVESLATSQTGGLWIGTDKGIVRLEQGRLTRYGGADSLPTGNVVTLAEDHSGRLWAGGIQAQASGLAVWQKGGVTRTYGTEDGLPTPQVVTLFQDSNGEMWVETTGGFCRWMGGGANRCMAADPPYQQSTGADQAKGPVGLVKAMLRDRNGNLWLATAGGGLLRWAHGRMERFTRRDGLSSDLVTALAEDHEGNLWVGTSNGFDRFREPKVARWSTIEGLPSNLIVAVCPSLSGDLWVATSGGGLSHVAGGRVVTYSRGSGWAGAPVLSLDEDRTGMLWMGTTRGLFHSSGKDFAEAKAVNGARFDRIFHITQDPQGTLWLADDAQGLAYVENGRIHPQSLPGTPSGLRIRQVQSDRHGNLWIGYSGGGVASFSQGSVRFFAGGMEVAGGSVNAITEDRQGSIWIGTGEGLSRFRNGTWTTWTAREGLLAGGVQAIIEDRGRQLWLIGRGGMWPLELSDLDLSPDGAAKRLSFPTYGAGDGIRMAESAGLSNPRVAMSRDGRIWIATADGLACIDPESIRTNPVPPPVAIEQLVVDGSPVDISRPRVTVRGNTIEVDYTALSLAQPEAVRFRYQLEEVDPHWIDAGSKRQIVYANLGPRDYQFRVTACNNDGIWNATGASIAFQVAPRFYQTLWFDGLCAGAVGMAIYGVHKLRVRQLRLRFQLVLQERSRLSREMHDTLLQGFAGVVYQLEAASRQAAKAPDESRMRIDRAIEQADQSLREAREALSSLRLSALQNNTLPEALRTAGEQIVDGTSIRFEPEVKGRVQELPYEVQANLYIIGREAMSNAMNHGEPGRILLQLVYSSDKVRLRVEDDGKGFDVERTSSRNNHWGLAGMRERANHIGAQFSLDSSPGCGTRVEVLVCKLSAKRRPAEPNS